MHVDQVVKAVVDEIARVVDCDEIETNEHLEPGKRVTIIRRTSETEFGAYMEWLRRKLIDDVD